MKKNCFHLGENGDALISVFSVALVIASLSLAIIQWSFYNSKKSNTARVKSAQDATNAFNLELATERFRIEGRKLPVWYPGPYPTADEMAKGTFPTIEVIQPIEPGAMAYVPVEMVTGNPLNPTLHFEADASRMGSVMLSKDIMKNSQGIATESQIAYLATGDVQSMSADMSAVFFQTPLTPGPLTQILPYRT